MREKENFYDRANGFLEHEDVSNDDIEIVDNKDGSMSAYFKLASGSVNSLSFLGDDDLDNLYEYYVYNSNNERKAKSAIKKTLFYFENEPIVFKCITLLSQLANDSFKISCENKDLEKKIKDWWKGIQGEMFLSAFFLEYFRSGNVPILRTLVPYYPGKEKSNIPAGYTILNPLKITLKNNDVISGFGDAYLDISDFYSLDGTITSRLSKFLGDNEVISDESNSFLPLKNELFTMVTKDKQPYESWALPLSSHAFDPLAYKRELREMDKATIRGLKNRILKVTIGSDTFPVLDPSELKELAREFSTPSKNLTIFWNHTLKVEFIEPGTDSLNIEKYEPVLEDIRCCFGIGKSLVGEQASSTGNNVLNLKGLIEILDEAQKSFISWFATQIEDVCKALGNKKEDVEIKFGKLNLKDENEYFSVITQLVDRQIISYETAMETIGFYFPKEIDRLKKEQKIRKKDEILMAQSAPTQKSNDESNNTNKTSPSDQGGRPKSITKEGDRKKSQDKPKTPSKLKTVSSYFDDISVANKTERIIKYEIGENLLSFLREKYEDLEEEDIKRKKTILMSCAREFVGNCENEDILNKYVSFFEKFLCE